MNIKQSFRIIFRNKTYSILNIAGLAIGIAASALILLWVEYQMNPNRSVPKREHLYNVVQNQYYGDDVRTFFTCSSGLFDAMNENLAGVKRTTRYSSSVLTFRNNENNSSFGEWGVYADSSLFSMIDLPFIAGNPQMAFEPAYPVVISQKMAQKIFGNNHPLGKTLYVSDQLYEVTAVFNDREENGTFRFEWLIPFRIYENDQIARGWQQSGGWGNNWFNCFIETEDHTDISAINRRLTSVFRERSGWGERNEIFIYPVQQQRLYGEFKDGKPTGSGYIRTVQMFFIIGMAILLIACINFMNMNTARSQKRTMEIGVRKVFGAKYLRLIGQFMRESTFVTFISLAIAVVLVLLALSPFNQLISLHLAVDVANPYHSLGLLGVGLLCALFSGIYPAFYMSSFSPIHTLKKLKTKTGNAGMIRKGLVVFQFTVSFVLICVTTIIYLQIHHVQNRPLGLETKNLVLFQAPDEIRRNFAAVQDALINTGVVAHSGLSNQRMIDIGSNGGGFNWQGKAPDVNPLISFVSVSPGLMEAAGIRFSEGRDFSWQYNGEKQEVIINRSFADIMGEEGRAGNLIERGDFKAQITGIVEDFVFNNYTQGKAGPVLIFPQTEHTGWLFVFVRLKENVRPGEAIATAQKTLQQFIPDALFEPSYMDEIFDNGFQGQRFAGKLAGLFAALAVFLSCMGLFGLSAFAAEQRTKEIGIRKVLGASIWDVVYMLGRSFMQLLLIALIIGVPAAWYAGRMYLQSYEYRMSLSMYIFAGAALLVFLIAMLTVSAQSLKVAMANPVKAIKSE